MRKRMLVLALLLLLVVGAGWGFFMARGEWSGFLAGSGRPAGEADALGGRQRLNVLLIGEDARPGEKAARADTIILASLDRQLGRVALVSIPRDTLVEIPGHGKNRINAALPLGGVELLRQAVGELLGVPVDRHVLVDFAGFERVVDALGGVDIEVEKDMYYRADDLTIDLKKGLQHLDGRQALQYVRFRHDALGDIARAKRQQKFLQALAGQAASPATLARLPRLLPALRAAVQTDLSAAEILALGRLLEGGGASLASATLPGGFREGTPYWYPDEEGARQVVDSLLTGSRVAEKKAAPAPAGQGERGLAGALQAPAGRRPAKPHPKAAPAPPPAGEGNLEQEGAAAPAAGEAVTAPAAPEAAAPATPPGTPPESGSPPGAAGQEAPGAQVQVEVTPAPALPAPGEDPGNLPAPVETTPPAGGAPLPESPPAQPATGSAAGAGGAPAGPAQS